MITSQVVAAHRPPSPPLPPPPILDFVQAVAARCCLSFPLSCAAVLRICMAHQAASPPIPSRQASALASSAHVPAAARMALAAPLCTTCHRHPHPVWHRICRHRRVHACARTRSVWLPKQQRSPPATANRVACARQPQLMSPPFTAAPVCSAQNIFAPATRQRVCDCIINGRWACMRGVGGVRGGGGVEGGQTSGQGQGQGQGNAASEAQALCCAAAATRRA